MDQREYVQELDRKIEQASRIASRMNDQTTVKRLLEFVSDLKWRRRKRMAREVTQIRAWELWDQAGRPSERDLEFWLQAEGEINGRNRE